MSSTYANAAADRIARVVQVPASTRPITSALDFVHRALEDDVASDVAAVELNETFFWYGDDREPVLRFVSFAGLVELAVRSRFLSIREWEGVDVLEQALRRFRATNAGPGSVDLHLVDALLGRFDESRSEAWSLDDDTIGIFESYLSLTGRVRGDDGVRTFLEKGSRRTIVPGDLAALVSPRHFAEAFDTGVIDGVPATDVAAGYRLLGYLEWLADILEALRDDDIIRPGIVRHARWAAGAQRIRDRFRGWMTQMREWEGDDRSWRDELWFEYEIQVFGTLMEEQSRLAVRDTGTAPVESEGESPPERELSPKEEASPDEQVERLVSQGRARAARELALSHAIDASGSEPTLGRATWVSWAETLVGRCLTLESLGGRAAAAALVAPILPRLLAQHGRSGWQLVADAQGLMARARTDVGSPETSSLESGEERESARSSEPKKAEQPRYRTLGEST